MRVGIMSMQRIINYGSYMQALSLKQIIESLGHDVQFVDYRIEPTIYDKNERFKKSIIKKIKRDLRNTKVGWAIANLVKRRPLSYRPENYFLNAKDKFEPSLDNLGVKSRYKNFRPKLDVLVIGSDEVFNCLQTNEDVGFSLELFGKNNRAKRLISYAASFGDTTLDRLQFYGVNEQVKRYLRKFDAISVRDKNSARIIEELVGQNCLQHFDPALIGDIEKQSWKNNNLCNYIAVYAYGNRIREDEGKEICEFGKSKNLDIISICGNQTFCRSIPFCSPDEIIPYFNNASYIITDTFHGVIFSVITHKQFVVFVREPKDEEYSNSNKLIDLLEKLGLEDRWAHSPDQIKEIIDKPIDFARIDAIRDEERERTLQYLRENIC